MKIVIFSTSDDGYIPNCIVSLLSIKKFHPTFDLYILTSDPSEKHIELCNRLNIKYIDIDLKKYFYKEWKYPRECYYHFKGPEIFHKLGYDYSIYIDGDIYCNKKINIKWSSIKHIAGVGYDKCINILDRLDNFSVIKEKFDIGKKSNFDRNNVQTGFLVYNNKNLSFWLHSMAGKFTFSTSGQCGSCSALSNTETVFFSQACWSYTRQYLLCMWPTSLVSGSYI